MQWLQLQSTCKWYDTRFVLQFTLVHYLSSSENSKVVLERKVLSVPSEIHLLFPEKHSPLAAKRQRNRHLWDRKTTLQKRLGKPAKTKW
jgi:hypothetical protein